jgi:hypothetical protein
MPVTPVTGFGRGGGSSSLGEQSTSNFRSRFEPVPVNRYFARISRGASMNNNVETDKIMSLRCESAELPGKSHATNNQLIYGPIRKIPYNSAFIDTTLTFMCSSDSMAEKRYFDEWQDEIQDPDSFDVAYYDDLIGTLSVKILNEKDVEIYSVDMIEAYPINVSSINVGWGQNNEYMKFSVTFSYRKWKRHAMK